jgi:hypothetical protein
MQVLLRLFARLLAVVHALFGGAIASGAVWLATQPWQRADLLAASALPLAAILGAAAWSVALGVKLWRLSPGWDKALRRTHWVVLVIAATQVVGGFAAIRGAARSAALGGGLLGGLGEIEVALGSALAALALTSLLFGYLARPRESR